MHLLSFSLTIILILVGSPTDPPESFAATSSSQDASQSLRHLADAELIRHLRELGHPLAGDTIHIYSPGWRESSDPMSGTELDTAHYGFFHPFYPQMANRNELYSVGYITIEPNITAYVLRVPSRYATTAMALWIYHEEKKHWLPPLVVADAFGDADWSFRQDAWLVDRDADGFLDLVWRRTDWVADTVYTDSLSWRFWQDAFDQWGWKRDLTESAEANVFTIPPRP